MSASYTYKKVALLLTPLYVTSLVVLILDRITKNLVIGELGTQVGAYRVLIGNVLWIRLVHNSGAAFGVLPNASIIFAISAIAVALGIVIYSQKLAASPALVRLSLGMILGGAIGNLIDRFMYGYVVDFVDFQMWPGLWKYVFNVADASITIGVILLLIYMVFGSTNKEPQKETPKPANDRAAHGD